MELMNQVEELKQKKATAQANAMLNAFKSEAAAATAGDAGNTAVNGAAANDADGDATTNDNDNTEKTLAEVLPGNPLASTNVNQKLRVCDVCGAFLSIFDSDRRLADHFGGKLHLGYLQIRKKIEEIADARRERRRQRNGVADELDAAKNAKTDKTEKKEDPSGPRRRERESRSRSRSRTRYVFCCVSN
jgi:hypothetical protein